MKEGYHEFLNPATLKVKRHLYAVMLSAGWRISTPQERWVICLACGLASEVLKQVQYDIILKNLSSFVPQDDKGANVIFPFKVPGFYLLNMTIFFYYLVRARFQRERNLGLHLQRKGPQKKPPLSERLHLYIIDSKKWRL
jgi:hypothetical protein